MLIFFAFAHYISNLFKYKFYTPKLFSNNKWTGAFLLLLVVYITKKLKLRCSITRNYKTFELKNYDEMLIVELF